MAEFLFQVNAVGLLIGYGTDFNQEVDRLAEEFMQPGYGDDTAARAEVTRLAAITVGTE